MKRMIALCAIASLILTGCGAASEPEESTKVVENLDVYDLPYPTMHYNDIPLELNSIDLYQSYDSDEYKYNPYCVVRIDASKASDEDIHYLCNADLGQSRDFYMKVRCYYTSETNKIKSDNMDYISRYRDGGDLVYLFYDYSQSDAIHSLEDMKVDVDIDIVQSNGELVKMTDTTAIKYSYDFYINGDSNIKVEVKDDSEIPDSENTMFEKGFGKIIQRGF